jgi:hypothetical protein
MSTVLDSTTQALVQPATTSGQPVAHKWGFQETHEAIEATCDKVGAFIIEAGQLAGGPVAMVVVNQGIEGLKNYATANYQEVSPLVNAVLDVVKVPLSVAAQRSAPLIAETSVKVIMPVPRAVAHGSANAVEKSADFSKKLWS